MDGNTGPPVHVTLLATPQTQVAPLSGLYEALTAFPLLGRLDPDLPRHPFEVQVAAPRPDQVIGSNPLCLAAHYTCDEIDRTDVAIVPLMTVDGSDWVPGRYPEAVDWLGRQHTRGALIGSTCTGVLLLAETGLLDGKDATIHWAFADTFRRAFPAVRLRADRALVTEGEHDDLVMTGGVTSWHDLALHLTARFVGHRAAQALARMLMLEWHDAGQAPYVEFAPGVGHDDGLVAALQGWLDKHFAVPNPVQQMCAHGGVTRRTLERRFRSATGHSPIAYVQHRRIGEARRLLERTQMPVDEVGIAVGYENTAYFRRLFHRTTRLHPGAYRRKFGTRSFR